jgi:uncharacterized protein (DUF934 family)
MSTIQILKTNNLNADEAATNNAHTLVLDNTTDANTVDFAQTQRIELSFPKFTDGRAYSQAFVLRRRGFQGDLRATGDVLVDQILQMQRTGFSSAVLREDQKIEHAQKLLAQFDVFYQGSVVQPQPHFA